MGIIDSTRQRRFSAEKMQKLNLFETDQMFCDVYCLRPGQAQHVHTHAGATKFYYVIEGEGRTNRTVWRTSRMATWSCWWRWRRIRTGRGASLIPPHLPLSPHRLHPDHQDVDVVVLLVTDR